jgi:hypothetical protein
MPDAFPLSPEAATVLDLDDLRSLITGCKKKSATLTYLEYVLSELGCPRRKDTPYNRASLLDLTTVIMEGFNPPIHVPIQVIRSGLATVCDAYARRRHQNLDDNHRIAMVLGLSKNGNWQTCLDEGHCPHAFAMNTLIALRRANTLGMEMVAMLNDWLTPGLGTLMTHEFPWLGAEEREADVLTAMFGEYWVLFNPVRQDGWRDLTLIMREKPDFLPGLLRGQHPDIHANCLPALG